jgi:hypothetical protein
VLGQKYPQLTVASVHPGIIKTDLYAPMNSSLPVRWATSIVMPLFFRDVHDGAKNTLWAATADQHEVRKGYYFDPIGYAVPGSKFAQDQELADELWRFTEREFERHGY